MEWLEAIPDNYRWLAIPVFVIGSAAIAAWSSRRGAREGRQPRTQEFAMSGQLADMGPVKELVEGVGLLFQQQVRTNIVLERLAVAYEAQIKADEVEQEIEEEVERRVDRQLRERRSRQGRVARKPPV